MSGIAGAGSLNNSPAQLGYGRAWLAFHPDSRTFRAGSPRDRDRPGG